MNTRHSKNVTSNKTMLPLVVFGSLLCVNASADPAFSTPVNNPFGLTAFTLSPRTELVDIDGDADLDAIVPNATTLVMFRNTGAASSPAFAGSTSNPFGLPAISYSNPCFGDIDGDGDFDLFLTTYPTRVFSYFENTGSTVAPAFAAAVTSPFGLVASGPGGVPVLADIDGDDDLDMFATDASYDVRVQINTGSSAAPAFSAAVSNPFGITSAGNVSGFDFGDLDLDGDLDALLTIGVNFFFHRNTGSASSPSFAAPVTNPFGLVASSTTNFPTIADLIQDGYPDILARDGNNFRRFKNFLPYGIQLTQSAITDHDNLRFNIVFSRPVSPSFIASDVSLNGSLTAGAVKYFSGSGGDPSHFVIVSLANPNASGTIGISITGTVTDVAGATLTVPVSSPLYTINSIPKGDVSKNGTFDLADVALLADANLGLTTLP